MPDNEEVDEQPVTRRDLVEALTSTKLELKTELKIELLEAIKEIVIEAVRDAQTEVLKAFLPYQESANVRMRALEAKLSNVDAGLSERVAIVERRLLELERRFLLNPPPA